MNSFNEKKIHNYVFEVETRKKERLMYIKNLRVLFNEGSKKNLNNLDYEKVANQVLMIFKNLEKNISIDLDELCKLSNLLKSLILEIKDNLNKLGSGEEFDFFKKFLFLIEDIFLNLNKIIDLIKTTNFQKIISRYAFLITSELEINRREMINKVNFKKIILEIRKLNSKKNINYMNLLLNNIKSNLEQLSFFEKNNLYKLSKQEISKKFKFFFLSLSSVIVGISVYFSFPIILGIEGKSLLLSVFAFRSSSTLVLNSFINNLNETRKKINIAIEFSQ